jgi:transmembrane sensor
MKPKSSTMNSQILDEACEWFVEFRAGDIDASLSQRFDEWLRRSPEHIRAYIDIARLYVEVPPPDPTGQIDVPALIAYANRDGNNVAPLPASIAAREATRLEAEALIGGRARAKREGFLVRRWALAASFITAIVVLSSLLVWQRERYPSYATDIGEHRSLALSDGSTVDLNARSKLRIEFSKDERLVELLEGQALFQVAKDKSRPFIVKSGDATVRAVGTQFDVDRKATGTTVTVLEGRVVVYSEARSEASASTTPASAQDTGAAPRTLVVSKKLQKSPAIVGAPPELPPGLASPDESGSGVYLGAGEQVTVTSKSLAPPEHADVTAATAWMQRRLIFDGTTLSDVVEQFNRNNRRQLIIDSDKLAGYHVSGTYSSTDPSSLVRFLREQPGFKITETDTEVRIASQ